MPFFAPSNIPDDPSRVIEVSEERASQVFRKQNQWVEVFIEKKEPPVEEVQVKKGPGRPRKEQR